jgi:hypothetical protein
MLLTIIKESYNLRLNHLEFHLADLKEKGHVGVFGEKLAY